MTARPIPELQTPRLRLRPIRTSDAGGFFDIFSDAEALRYWSREPIQTLVEAEELVQRELTWAASGSCVNWAVELRESGEFIGKVVLFNLDEQNRRAEIGYILGRRHWGRGFMTETLSRVLAHAFGELGLHRVEADTDPGNVPSLALLKRFGFQREGLFRERWYVHGKWHDSIMCGLLKHDFAE